jgi:hypothetical protein
LNGVDPGAVTLRSAPGRVVPAASFVRERYDTFAPAEQALLERALSDQSEPCPLPDPLVRTAGGGDGRYELAARRAGRRSALLPGLGLRIKGCRPEPGDFPKWTLDDDFSLRRERIPFGSLDADGAAREILAACFLRANGLPAAAEPIAVFAYAGEAGGAHAVVSRFAGDERLESRLDANGLTTHSLLRASASGRCSGLGREIALRGVDACGYVAAKARLLAAMHFAGGFRGLLNSNIGNDVVAGDRLLALCDFDTFEVREIPAAGDEDDIRRFVISAMIEVAKSSLPFVDYLPLPRGDAAGAVRSLADYYRERSTLFRAYRDLLLRGVHERDWPESVVHAALDETFRLDVVFEILQELIPNPLTMGRFTGETPYAPHN